ncbi:BMC domain-containing protein, partial [Candidatus Cyanaurora vandensis]
MSSLQPASPSYTDTSLGLVSTRSYPAAVGVADTMVKASGVHLLGYEKTGSGYCTVVVRGSLADVRLAVAEGKQTAEDFGQLVSWAMLPRPLPNLDAVLPIGHMLAVRIGGGGGRYRHLAAGLLETLGFPVLVAVCDAMLKAADVTLTGYERTGGGLCTAVIRGKVADVVAAIEVGISTAELLGGLQAVMVVPQPLD